MARRRWTLTLIIICLPILATVITAFRIRDLPKSSQDTHKSDLKKCEDCDVNVLKVDHKSHTVKIESDKRNEQLKKTVHEKQQIINQKTSESKSSFKLTVDSDDEDDDFDDVELLSKTGFRQQKTSTAVKHEKANNEKPIRRYSGTNVADDDDDDDDDDEDDDDEIDNDKIHKDASLPKKSKLGTPRIIEKGSPPKLVHIESAPKKSIVKTTVKIDREDDDDEDDDEDDDDNDDDDIISISTKKVQGDIKKAKKSDLDVRLKREPKSIDKQEVKPVINAKKDKVEADPKVKNTEAKFKTKSDKGESEINKEIKKTDSVVKELKQERVKLVTEKEKVVPQNINKDDKRETKDTKQVADKLIKESVKKSKEPEKNIKSTEPKHPMIEEKKAEKKSPEQKAKEDKPKLTESKKESKPDHKRDSKTEEASLDEVTKSDSHLKQISDAVKRRNLLQSEFEDYYAYFPTFAPNFSRIHNPECRRHGQILLRQLRGTKLWALNMLDATAKIPSGILQGNGIQLGDFDQCLGSRARVQLETGSVVKVQGKYCLARLDVRAESPELELPVHLAQAKNLIKSRIDDPGHFVPRFSTLSWGICLPAACKPEDAEVVIKDALLHYQHTSGLVVRVKVDGTDCHTLPGSDWWEDWLELPTLLTLAFYAFVILLVLVATVQDFLSRRKSKGESDELDDKAECDQTESKGDEKEKDVGESKQSDGFLSAFSLYRTVKKLIAPGTTDEISCIHGIRGLATIALLVAHKFLPVAVMPYTNRVKITEVVSSPLWSWCRAGWMFTDCFLLLSGVLTAHRIVDSDTAAPRRLLSRYLRLTPALLAVVLFYAYVWDNISDGPMWGTLVTKNAEVCQEGWWWNLLYVQNYFGFDDMCAPQTHQLALDMQLTILGGVIVWAIQTKEGMSKIALLFIHMLTAYSRYTTVRDHRLTLLAYHGVSVSQLYRTARLTYTSTFHRSTPYLIGLSLGLALKKPSIHGKLVLTLGWLLSVALWGSVWWAGSDSGYTQYRYSAIFAAQYAAFAPIASALAIAWVIYVVHSGNCESLSGFLCCRPLVLVSRLSYALYLCQFVVFLSLAGTVRTSSEFSIVNLVDIYEISVILLSSTVLTLTFIIPMQSLQKISFRSSLDNREVSITQDDGGSDSKGEQELGKEDESEEREEKIEVPQIRSRQHLVAHREVLEEIPEVEMEFETRREKNEGLEEILEEEEDEEGVEDEGNDQDDDLEIIEEEQGGEDELWEEREEYPIRRPYSRNNEDRDLDEWEWTANGSSRNGAQHYRYGR